MFEPEELMARIVDLEAQLKVSEMAPPAAEQLIACLEGEIAKRDEELAACRTAVENCELFRARIAELEDDLKCAHSMLAEVSKAGMALRAELSAIKAQEPVFMWHKGATEDESEVVDVDCACPCCVPLYAAPVSEAKAQGVVIDEREEFENVYSGEYGTPISVLKLLREGENYIERPQHSDRLNSSWWMWKKARNRLNAAPVQQVSVPASAFASRAITHYEAALLAAFPSGSSGEVFNQWNEARRVLAATPAAPAADASDVLEQAMYTLISIGYHENSGLVHELRQALSTQRAKGVV